MSIAVQLVDVGDILSRHKCHYKNVSVRVFELFVLLEIPTVKVGFTLIRYHETNEIKMSIAARRNSSIRAKK